ncbi:MAG: L,D-transpeptidase family protein [Candidatus Latescibacterota bacterium]
MGAKEYAPERLQEAEEALQRTIDAIEEQRGRLFLLREYTQAWLALGASLEAASLAKREAIACRDSLYGETDAEIMRVKVSAQQIRKKMVRLPLDRYSGTRMTRAEIALSEAQSSFLAEDLFVAGAKAREASEQIMEVEHRLGTILKAYLNPQALAWWKQWAAETMAWSDQHDTYALIVDKLGRRCDLYFDGKLLESYPADLGFGPLGDKTMRGDAVTPEGKYWIVAKRGAEVSSYHRSLVINYPTQEDLIRFQRAKTKGLLPRGAKIGGEIALHGGGMRQKNWTAGCIALLDSDMERAFRLTSVGTPVTIVGQYRE